MATKTKKSMKDLSPKKNPKGGATAKKSPGAQDNITLVRASKPKVKDLDPKGNPKGGKKQEKLSANDSMTLVRSAKPIKDIAPKKNPRGGATAKKQP